LNSRRHTDPLSSQHEIDGYQVDMYRHMAMMHDHMISQMPLK